MAEIRDVKGPIEAAGLTVEQVQEWLANPCTIALKHEADVMLDEASDKITETALNYAASNDSTLAAVMRRMTNEFCAVQKVCELLRGADRYASDK